MFLFKFEPELSLLTATRTGVWTLDTVASYEIALRSKLAELQSLGRLSSFIIDVRSSGPQSAAVADALRLVVQRLGPLHANRTAVVTLGGLEKLQARRVADVNDQVFTSMVLARGWVTGHVGHMNPVGMIHDEASIAEAEGPSVHIHGPANVDVSLTPAAALKTSKRIEDAAVEVLLGTAAPLSQVA